MRRLLLRPGTQYRHLGLEAKLRRRAGLAREVSAGVPGLPVHLADERGPDVRGQDHQGAPSAPETRAMSVWPSTLAGSAAAVADPTTNPGNWVGRPGCGIMVDGNPGTLPAAPHRYRITPASAAGTRPREATTMLLTITSTTSPATDLEYLLH